VLVNCDAPQIRQAIANILKNAIEAIESKTGGSREEGAGKITVEVGVRHNEAFIEVTDDGVGLPEDDIRQRLTEPYITTRSKGTGLGLAIVWKIIEDHRGRLDMEDAPGGGAKVSFWFPMAEKSTDTSQLNVGDDQTDSDHADSKIIAKSA